MRPLEQIEMMVYSCPDPIPYDPYTIPIPEINYRNCISVFVLVKLYGIDMWEELPFYLEGIPEFGRAYSIADGELTFIDCQFYYYRVFVIY